MRWLFLASLLIAFPVILYYAKQGVRQRDNLLLVLGSLLFATGSIALDAAVITWPVWPGTARGIVFSFIDCIALALLVTRRSRSPMPPFLLLSGLLLVSMVMASFLATVKVASMFVVLQFVQVVFLYFSIAPELARQNAITNLLKGIAIGLVVQAGYVAYQKLTGIVQASGTAAHQNILGMMVQFGTFPIMAAIMEGSRSKLLYLGAVAGMICVAGGGSRGTLAFFAMGFILLLLLSLIRKSSSRKLGIIGAAVVGGLIMVPLALGTLRDRFGDSEIGTTDESRLAFERAARAMADDHPFGVGPNNFVTVNNTQGYAAAANIAWGGGLLDKPVHNAFLLARSEMGWLGEFTFILLLGGVATKAFVTGFKAKNASIVGVSLGSGVAILTTGIHSNYEYAWFMVESQRLFFVNAALIAGCAAIARQLVLDERRLRREELATAQASPK